MKTLWALVEHNLNLGYNTYIAIIEFNFDITLNRTWKLKSLGEGGKGESKFKCNMYIEYQVFIIAEFIWQTWVSGSNMNQLENMTEHRLISFLILRLHSTED